MDARLVLLAGILLGIVPGFLVACWCWKKIFLMPTNVADWLFIAISVVILLCWFAVFILSGTDQLKYLL